MWIYYHLERHPQVCFPGGKELHYWDLDPDADGVGWLARFADVPPGKLAGEYTPAYATLRTATVRRIADLCPVCA